MPIWRVYEDIDQLCRANLKSSCKGAESVRREKRCLVTESAWIQFSRNWNTAKTVSCRMGQYSDADSSLEGNVPEADVVQEGAADANDQLWCSGGVPATIKSPSTQSFSKRPQPPPILSRCTFDHKQPVMLRSLMEIKWWEALTWFGLESLKSWVISLKVNWIDCKFDFSPLSAKQKNPDLCFPFRSSACLMSICLNYRKSGTFLVWRPAHVDNWIGRKYVLHCSCQPNSCRETACLV